jgi:hypothetical protein
MPKGGGPNLWALIGDWATFLAETKDSITISLKQYTTIDFIYFTFISYSQIGNGEGTAKTL